MAALSFHGALCVRACTLQAASTTPCAVTTLQSSPSTSLSSYLAHQLLPPPFAARPPSLILSYLELYQNIITDCRVQVYCTRICVCTCIRIRIHVCTESCPSRGPRAIFSHYATRRLPPPFASPSYDANRQA